MPIPNLAAASFAAQAEPDSVDFDIITAAATGTGVRNGCACTPGNSGVNLSVAVAAGSVCVASKTPVAVAAATVTPGAASGANPRFDLVVASSAGVLSVVAGTAAAAPVFPAIPAASVVLCAVWIPTSATSITASNIIDKRQMVNYELPGPGVASTRAGELRTFRTAWANRGTLPCNIVCLGDSVTVGYYASTASKRLFDVLMSRLCQENGQPVPHGYVPMSSTSHGGYTGRIWTATAGTITDRNDSGLGYNNSTISVGGIASYTAVCDRIWVMYPNFVANAGTFNVSIDGSVVTSINPNTGTSFGGRVYDSGALTHGSHTVAITQTGAFGAILEGAVFFDGNGGSSGTNGNGARIFMGGHFGKTAANFAVAQANGIWWTDGFDTIVPHLVCIFLGINDQRSGRTTTQYHDDLITIVNRFTTVAATNNVKPPSVCFVLPYGVGLTADLTPPYTAAAKDAAAQVGAAWVDLYQLMGFVGTAAADDPPAGYGYMSAIDPSTDKVHPLDKGHTLIGEAIAGYLLDSVGPGERVGAASLRMTSTDGTGTLIMPSQTTGTPSAPPVDTMAVYGLKKAGRDLPYRRGPLEPASALMAALHGSMPFLVMPSTGANLASPFGSNTNLGTITHPTFADTQGWIANLATAASANATAGTQSTNPMFIRGTSGGIASGFFYHVRALFPDASYANTGATTGTRMIFGLTDQLFATVLGSDNPAGNRVCFQYCNVNAARVQTTFNITTKNNATETLTDTGVALAQNKLYELWLWCAPGATTIGWQIDNLTDSTTASGTTAGNMPVAATAMRAVAGLLTINAVARNWRMGRLFCETP